MNVWRKLIRVNELPLWKKLVVLVVAVPVAVISVALLMLGAAQIDKHFHPQDYEFEIAATTTPYSLRIQNDGSVLQTDCKVSAINARGTFISASFTLPAGKTVPVLYETLFTEDGQQFPHGFRARRVHIRCGHKFADFGVN